MFACNSDDPVELQTIVARSYYRRYEPPEVDIRVFVTLWRVAGSNLLWSGDKEPSSTVTLPPISSLGITSE